MRRDSGRGIECIDGRFTRSASNAAIHIQDKGFIRASWYSVVSVLMKEESYYTAGFQNVKRNGGAD